MEVHASLSAEQVASLGPIPITNSMLMAWAAIIVLSVFAYFAGRNPQLVPTEAQNVFEAILEALLSLVENTAGHYARRVFPLVATLFIFILTANYMGLLPGVGTITVASPVHPGETVPLLRAANADLNMTVAMGLVAFFFIHASGIYVHGLVGYIRDDLANPVLMTPIKIVIELFVPVSLSMRLFGNVFGGDMLLTVMNFPVVGTVFMGLELLFGFIQAIIFSILTLIFTSVATYLPAGHGEGHEREGGHGAAPAATEAPGDRGSSREPATVAGHA
jgi:F-type H+-transporting ATPase subunit a